MTLNLKNPKAREIVLQRGDRNFRPGQLAKLGTGPEEMRKVRQYLLVAHVSGYGQTGPCRNCAVFGVIGEAIGGLRHLTNQRPSKTDLPPVRAGISIGDSLAGLYAKFGGQAAQWQRDRQNGDGLSRTIDVTLTESVLNLMEGMLPNHTVVIDLKIQGER